MEMKEPCHDCGYMECRCSFCGRCAKLTESKIQGHYTSLCKVQIKLGKDPLKTLTEHHFCCPGDCELYFQDGTLRKYELPFDFKYL